MKAISDAILIILPFIWVIIIAEGIFRSINALLTHYPVCSKI
jgi:hypothetical protein